jgi:hypothetical protein
MLTANWFGFHINGVVCSNVGDWFPDREHVGWWVCLN